MQKRSSTNSIFLPPLFDSITDEVLIVDREYRIAWFNKAFKNEYEKKFGSSISVGDMVSTLQSEPASSIVILDTWQRVFSGGEFSITEQYKGNVDTYMELRFVPIKDAGEKVVAAAVFIKDVTFIRRAEIDLIQSRIILQESQHIAKLTRWTFEVGSATIDWDNTFHEVFGVSFKTEKTKEKFFNCFTASSKKEFEETIKKAVEDKKNEFSIDSEIITEDTTHRFIHTLAKIEYNKDSKVLVIGVSNDVSEIKEASRRLTERNRELENTKSAMLNVLEDVQELEKKTTQKVQQLNAILSSMREALVAVDEKMNIVLINEAAGALLRIAPQDAIGKSFAEICPFYKNDKKIPERIYPLKKALVEKTIISFDITDEISIKDHTGKFVPIALTASYLAAEVDISAIAIMRDITKEKEVDLAKTELISLASHQLRTPLSSVNWYAEMLLAGDAGSLSEEAHMYVTEIYKGNHRMIDLVNALLNVSRVDLGKIMIEPEKVMLPALVDGVFEDLALMVKEKNITFLKKIPKTISSYTGDKKIITITLQNLFSNAVKYTPAEGIITFSVVRAKKGETIGEYTLLRDSLVFSVADTGYGIPKKDQPKIFSKLYRADNVKEMEANGNGLGLYLVKSMVETAGGKVWFTSVPDKGSTFYVALPEKGMEKRAGVTVFT